MTVTNEAAQRFIAGFLQKAVEDFRECQAMDIISLNSPFPRTNLKGPKGLSTEDVWHLARMFYQLSDLVELFRVIDSRLDAEDIKSML